MEISTAMVKSLRERTNAGIMECKRALEETGGDMDKAAELLRQKELSKAAKKSDRVASQGVIDAYIHSNGRYGALVELNCETDFVARTDAFRMLAHDLALHIVGKNPTYISVDNIPAEVMAALRETFLTEATEDGRKKSEEILEKIISGKLEKYYMDHVLLRQAFVKDEERTVQNLLTEAIATLGENIVIRRFARFELGES
ncbi:MAG: translation elongation factor Ts [Chloroflexi bacterium]|nr:translation elongation factor Ts [Chloroflexota bacterium]